MRIAIVGAGISGLASAHILRRRHHITAFEARSRPGGHTNTVAVECGEQTHNVDTGFIVFNDRNYPNFERLLSQLEVASQPSQMSFGVSDLAGDFEYNGASPNGLFAKRSHLVAPSFHRMIVDLLRFNRQARLLLCDRGGEEPSLGDWLARQSFSKPFVERLVVPQASAVWSADPQQMWSFPARLLVEFFDNHGMLGFRDRPRWRTITGGAARYVDALVDPWREQLRLQTPVESIVRHQDHVLLTPRGGAPERFDHVVIATHSDQALAMLADPSDAEREILEAIPYIDNEAVLHRDERMLPRRRRAWASWNYHLVDSAPAKPTVTYHLNRLQSLSAQEQICVTLNRTADIRPEKVIETIPYAHPVYTAAGLRAQKRWREISGRRRTHYCGAYWGSGFHEDGVVSAVRVAESFGEQL